MSHIQHCEHRLNNSLYCFAEPDANGHMGWVRDTDPVGCNCLFSPAEQLRSYQLRLEGHRSRDTHSDIKINGPAADFWASGVVLFELLTGDLPFVLVSKTKRLLMSLVGKKVLPMAPPTVHLEDQQQWQELEAMRLLHHQWVSMHCLPAECKSHLYSCLHRGMMSEQHHKGGSR